MPWKEQKIMDQKKEFVLRALSENIPFSGLCSEYGIARKTGYKWRKRFLEEGNIGLTEKSRRPNNSPNHLDEDTVIKIIALRHSHPSWGAKKIAKILEKSKDAPSLSSVYRILDKGNLLKRKRIKRAELNKGNLHQLITPDAPNDVWTIDYKGWWLTHDMKRCNPLTIRDLKSRYTLTITLTERQDADAVKGVLERVFKEYGLPKVIRSDNGTPFAAYNSPLGISSLSASWMALGILPDRIAPGKPYQNGSHERMHRDLKEDVQKVLHKDSCYYQRVIDQFCHDYNFIRPHEALGMVTPGEVYLPSKRRFTGYPDEIEYPMGMERRKVDKNGKIKLENQIIRITSALSGYHVGLSYLNRDTFRVWFSDFLIGEIDLVASSFYTVANRE